MNNVFAIIGILCALSDPFVTFCLPVQPSFQIEEKAKKEPVYTVISTKYVLTSTIIDDFFRAAKITTYSYNKEEINKIKIPKFQIFEKNFEDTKYLLEKFLSVQFETDEKKTYYMVKKK
jgi:hypothetical protein